jgi:hypothetical protein
VSGGTCGIGPNDMDKYVVASRLPSKSSPEGKKIRDFGGELFVIIDNEELVRYLFRFAYGDAKMGSAGLSDGDNGTTPAFVDLCGYNANISERNKMPGIELPYLLSQRGGLGFEISGAKDPKDPTPDLYPTAEVACNPKIGYKGIEINRIGTTYDFSKGRFNLETGIDFSSIQVNAEFDLHHNEYHIVVNKVFKF